MNIFTADDRKNLFTGYVLAGGKSSRMRRDKAFLKISGETFLHRAVSNLSAVCGRVKIVLNKSQIDFVAKLPENVAHIFDIFENRGALGGIHAALKDCETEFALILAVDLPLANSAIEKLSCIAVEKNDFAAFVPRQSDGRLQPLCAVYRTAQCLAECEHLLEQNDAAARDLLANVPTFVVTDFTNDFFNVNRPEDYEQLRNFPNKKRDGDKTVS